MARVTKAVIDHVKSRVNTKIMCVNGEIKHKIDSQMLNESIPFDEKVRLIHAGKLKLNDKINSKSFIMSAKVDEIIDEVFNIRDLPQLKKIVEHNNRLKERMTEAQLTIEHYGERLVDDIVVGNVDLSEIPEKIEELSKMVEKIL